MAMPSMGAGAPPAPPMGGDMGAGADPNAAQGGIPFQCPNCGTVSQKYLSDTPQPTAEPEAETPSEDMPPPDQGAGELPPPDASGGGAPEPDADDTKARLADIGSKYGRNK